jgi:hypothetical protein
MVGKTYPSSKAGRIALATDFDIRRLKGKKSGTDWWLSIDIK